MWFAFLNQGGRRGNRGAKRKPRPRARLRLEVQSLEDRLVPTTWTVTNLTDGAQNSLRDLIDNHAQNGDTINFLYGLSGTVTLTSCEPTPHR